jgi:predicted secreted hydrolase
MRRLRGIVVVAVITAAVSLIKFAIAAAPEHPQFLQVRPGAVFHFPADHGAHPEFRNEWWYITGWLKRPDGRPMGFQVTFFRFRPGIAEDNPSIFEPRQILFAHAALSDPAAGKLLHQERIYRAGFGLAEVATHDANVTIGDWALKRSEDGRFHTTVRGKDFTFDLSFAPTEAVLPEGENGYSRKGPKPEDASYYYSMPHLTVSGSVARNGQSETVSGSAWLDREWSSNYLDAAASGWDWIGLNLDGGGALMAFRIRDGAGKTFWAGGTLRETNGATHALAPDDVQFTALRRWRSPGSGAIYPVETMIAVRLPDGERQFRLTPLFDNQEYDSRATGGPVYWEGAVRSESASGYLEMTGYFHPLKM